MPTSDTTVDALIVDFLLWLAARERTYAETLEAWRTSCPRLTVWEDANDRGLVGRSQVDGRELVHVAPKGVAFLRARGLRVSQASQSNPASTP